MPHSLEDQYQERLLQILENIQMNSLLQAGYAGGNALNILCQLNTDLSKYNFSYLTVWQAYLKGVNLYHVDFTYSDLAKSVFC